MAEKSNRRSRSPRPYVPKCEATVSPAPKDQRDADFNGPDRADLLKALRQADQAPAPNAVPRPTSRHLGTKSKFNTTLSAGGPTALLLAVDLANEDDLFQFHGRVSWATGTRSPTLPQLRLAQQLGQALNDAILAGDSPPIWEQVRRARDAMFGVEDARRAALELVQDLYAFRRRHDAFLKNRESRSGNRPRLNDHLLRDRIEITLRNLAALDSLFASLTSKELHALLLTKNLRALGIMTKVSLLTGAQGAERQAHETADAAFKRVKRNYEKAVEKATRLSKQKPT